MVLKESVYRVLLVSASEKFSRSVHALLPAAQFSPVTVVDNADAARRVMLERSVDLLLINSPLPDETGLHLARSVASDGRIGVLLFAKSEWYDEYSSELMPYGVLVLFKPTSPQSVLQSVRLLCAARERVMRLEKRNESLEEKLVEIRLVNRAKWYMIRAYSMTEEDAHRYIEKLAMDRCVSKRAIAEEILREDGKE